MTPSRFLAFWLADWIAEILWAKVALRTWETARLQPDLREPTRIRRKAASTPTGLVLSVWREAEKVVMVEKAPKEVVCNSRS
jgi:hypothetical protein